MTSWRKAQKYYYFSTEELCVLCDLFQIIKDISPDSHERWSEVQLSLFEDIKGELKDRGMTMERMRQRSERVRELEKEKKDV